MRGAIDQSTEPAGLSRTSLEAYATWLFYERRILCYELWPGVPHSDSLVIENGATDFHFTGPGGSWNERPQPSTRAAAVMSAAGFDWAKMRRKRTDVMAEAAKKPALPAPVGFPAADAAVLAADRRHADLTITINAGGLADDALDRVGSELRAAERVLCETPSESYAGMQAKARALKRLIVGNDSLRLSCPEGQDDIGHMTWSLLRDVLENWSPIDRAMATLAVPDTEAAVEGIQS